MARFAAMLLMAVVTATLCAGTPAIGEPMPKGKAVVRTKGDGWLESPRPWMKLPAEVREALRQGHPRFSDQIAESPFGAQLAVMDDKIDLDRIPQLLDQFAATGMKWIRDGAVAGVAAEGKVYPSGGSAADTWADLKIPDFYFTFLKEARARGINLLVTLRVVGLPGGKVTGSGEAGRKALAGWCKAVVPPLKPWVKDWEIDNEPNPEIPPEEYVAAVRVAYEIIKEIDPEARVYAGVLANLECLASVEKGGREPVEKQAYPKDPKVGYVDALLEAGLLEVCDVLSFHPYRPPITVPLLENIPEHASEYPPWNKWADYPAQIDDLKARLRRVGGRDFPIANTEFGIPGHFNRETGQRFISLEAQAKYELRACIMDHWLGVKPIISFAFKRLARGLYYDEANLGMMTPDWTRTPKYYAYTGLCSLLDGGDEPLEVPVRLLAPDAKAAGPLRFYAFHKRQDLSIVPVEVPQPGQYVEGPRREQPVEMVTMAFWRAVPAAEDGATVPIDLELTLPKGDYGYPLLLDPRNMLSSPYTARAYRQRGNAYVLSGLPVGDSPLMVRFFRLEVNR
ncbi:MAG: hypothetical protein HY318_09550 [Armatimonadetes bacterium]|nr:hypothetical protein [Armatimonadota bacterium]